MYVSVAWAELLSILVEKDGVSEVFKKWPPEQPVDARGDAAYWQALPQQVIRAITSRCLRVWPIIQPTPMVSSTSRSLHTDLSSVLVSTQGDDPCNINTLTLTGIAIVQPPEYILRLLGSSEIEYSVLTPDTAYQALLRDVPNIALALQGLTSSDKNRLLVYLLSTNNLGNVKGLPLAPLVNGTLAVFESPAADVVCHTLFEKEDAAVYRQYDELALALFRLPSSVVSLMCSMGPHHLNVRPLTNDHVVNYLGIAFREFGVPLQGTPSVHLDNTGVQWILRFWEWLAKSTMRVKLLPSIRHFSLVACSDGALRPCTGPIFDASSVDVGTQAALGQIGLVFLHPAFPLSAHRVLRDLKILNSVDEAHDVLSHAKISCTVDVPAAKKIRHHLANSLPVSHRKADLLKGTLWRALRALPIYPLLRPGAGGETPVILGDIPESTRVESVTGITLIPEVQGVLFLDDCYPLLRFLRGEAKSSELRLEGVVRLALDHFCEQPKHLQRAFLECLLSRRESFPSGFYTTLKKAAFVAVGNDSCWAPQDVVDPGSVIACLYPPIQEYHSKFCLPATSLPDDAAIVTNLRRLGLLQSQLSAGVVEDRIKFLTTAPPISPETRTLSHQLLDAMIQSNFDCSQLRGLNAEARWLPTRQGLCRATECHHPAAHPTELFDEVLPILDVDVSMLPRSLLVFLGWDRPLEYNVLKQQFAAVLTSNPDAIFRKMPPVLEVLSRLPLSSSDVADLRTLVHDVDWIPISPERCAPTSHVILSSQYTLPIGFSLVPPVLARDVHLYDFLRRMGCQDRPSPDVIFQDLALIARSCSAVLPIMRVVSLLQALDVAGFGEGDFERVLVPDLQEHMVPSPRLFYNDMGQRANLVSLPENTSIAHSSISKKLATYLRIPSLSISDLSMIDDDDKEMGEPLTKRIKNALNQYGIEQVFGEFLANALDAGAQQFEVLVDENRTQVSQILFPDFPELHSEPSLIFYNNAIFTLRDYKGIKDTGTGGKEDRADTIGQFGLGALSAYHFTELLMILSGDHVMFLDPSRRYLPDGRSCLRMPLATMKSRFPDHLKALHNVFGFSNEQVYYTGTIFKLPLRSPAYALKSLMSATSISLGHVFRLVSGHYKEVAHQTPIFSGISSITASHRNSGGALNMLWSVSCARNRIQHMGDVCSHELLHISGHEVKDIDDWHVVYHKVPRCKLPSHFHPLVDKHRLRDPIKVGIAACVTGASHSDTTTRSSKVFSTLPLPISTALPVHLNGSFILAEDRRSFRFDADGELNLESQYNRWIMRDLAPPLYLLLLEILLQESTRPDWWRWWPLTPIDQQGHPASALVNSFYRVHLPGTDRKVCLSITSEKITPCCAVLLPEKPKAVARLLRYLRPSTVLDSSFPLEFIKNCSEVVKPADGAFVRESILRNAHDVVAAYARNEDGLTLLDVQGIVDFLLAQDPHLLSGLPLLPLSNGDVVAFRPLDGPSCPRYYSWVPIDRSQALCPATSLLHRDFKALDVIDTRIFDIVNLYGAEAEVQDMIKHSIPQTPVLPNVTEEQRILIESIWTEFACLGVPISSLKLFPLVPTTEPATYVSIGNMAAGEVVVVSEFSPLWMSRALNQLGIITVENNKCPTTLSAHITTNFPSISDRAVIKLVAALPGSLTHHFSQLDEGLWESFASWARPLIYGLDIDNISRLPIWKAGESDSFLPASDIILLPATVWCEVVASFLPAHMRRRLVNYDGELHRLKPESWSVDDVRVNLTVKARTSLNVNRLSCYKRLVRAMLNARSGASALLIPNSNGVLAPSDTLYSRSVNLFLSAFGPHSAHFIHDSYSDLEDALVEFGLRNELNFDTFKAAAAAVDGGALSDTPNLGCARQLFVYYCGDLAIRISSDDSKWSQLSSLRFIPRRTLRRSRVTFDSLSYENALPVLLTAGESLRPELEGVAWTQRAIPDYPAVNRMLLANLGFGVPSVAQVIEHLRVLIHVARDHPQDKHVLSDVRESYQWLSDHCEEAEELIQPYRAESLFLNVDDPDDTWVWHHAGQLFFNAPDSESRAQYGVRSFLMPFRDLLLATGVRELKNPAYRPPVQLSPAEERLANLRSTWDSLRAKGTLTDTIFKAIDGQEFRAHRAYMATVSAYFVGIFCGGFKEAGPATVDDPIYVHVEYPAVCVKVCLDYVYRGTAPEIETLAIDDLLLLLKLSLYWGVSELHMEVQRQLIVSHLSLFTYADFRQFGERHQATDLVEACKQYETDNEEVIAQLDLESADT
ncbi:hypothetical protein BV22DRAFT_1094901 [Leucogyrophana mollusca]|uniref:Uncharacterized protein n=1 Tax=Leucogyrophana mollusca TaxID=85980 RepID=A0ACB8B9D6_9AGAM|nr:hypothetical protein BV22DRAFT_1094901 [Leucogyrophana mollusca]